MKYNIYGKTCENLAKHFDIRLVTDRKECHKLMGKPQCQAIRFVNDPLGAHNLKVTVTSTNPFYVGFAVLELSKLHLFKDVA